jgi:hypothetical protein
MTVSAIHVRPRNWRDDRLFLLSRGSQDWINGRPPPDSREDRLEWAHGPRRAAAIMAGEDLETQIDIAKWEALGRHARSS